MRKLLIGLLATTLATGAAQFGLTQAHASSPAYSTRMGKILGIVRPLSTNSNGLPVATGQPSTGALYYNGGPVQVTNKVYTIFWQPSGYSFPSGYQDQLNQFFQNVAADRGKTTSSYDAPTQYYQIVNGQKQYIQNSTTYMGTTVDTNALPPLDPVNCYDTAFAAGNGVDKTSPTNNSAPSSTPYCVTDAQIQQEVSNVIKAKGWPVDNNTQFFMYTAPQIGTCIPNTVGVGAGGVQTQVSPPLCSFSGFCAYHSWYFDSTVNPASQIVYANMPYAYQTHGMSPTCDDRYYPNGNGGPDAADPEINVTSHEHTEALTDPFGTGWWDSNANDSSAGMEIGDMCAYVWGQLNGTPAPTVATVPGVTTVGQPASGTYSQQWNQTINGHHYIAQQEWSNADSVVPANNGNGCVSHETPMFTLTPNIGYPSAPFKIDGPPGLDTPGSQPGAQQYGGLLFLPANTTVSFTFTSQGSTTRETLGSVTGDASGHAAKFMTSVPADALAGTATITATPVDGSAASTQAFTVPSP